MLWHPRGRVLENPLSPSVEPSSAKSRWVLASVPVFKTVKDKPRLDDLLRVLRLTGIEVEIRADNVGHVLFLGCT